MAITTLKRRVPSTDCNHAYELRCDWCGHFARIDRGLAVAEAEERLHYQRCPEIRKALSRGCSGSCLQVDNTPVPGSLCPWSVECPTCRAAPGRRCRRPSGHKCMMHATRYLLTEGIDRAKGLY